jgi:hypothetical protein
MPLARGVSSAQKLGAAPERVNVAERIRSLPVLYGHDYLSPTPMPSSFSRAFALASLAALACGGPRTAAAPPAPLTEANPATNAGQLARFAALRVMVLPSQGAWRTDSLGWRARAGTERELLGLLDRSIETALGERGLSSQWVFPPAMERTAKRNPTYVTDPYAMRALVAVRAALRKPQDPVAEPFASQLRTLAGVSDSRYAFVPLDVRMEPVAAGGGRAVLRAAVIDARGAQLVWTGDVAGEAQSEYSEALFTSLAERVADLVVPR